MATPSATTAEITLYDVIDPLWGISAVSIRQQIKAIPATVKTIRVRINSPGGSIFDGTAIFNQLRSHPARKIVTVDGLAASIASVVAMAGDEIEMGEGAYMMIHDPLGYVRGAADDMRDMGDLLDKMKGQLVGIYARRTGRDAAEIDAMMGDETWFTATEAVDAGFADRTVPGLALAASFDASRFRFVNCPPILKGKDMSNKTDTTKPATVAELKAALGSDCPSDFLINALERELTVAEAQSEFISHLKATAKKQPKIGIAPIPSNGYGSEDGDPIAVWNAILHGYAREGIKEGKAMSRAVREHPQEHREYILAWNRSHGRRSADLPARYPGE